MKTYARIQDGAVAEFFTTGEDISRMFHGALLWIDVSAIDPAPQLGWTFNGQAFAEPPPAAPPSNLPPVQKAAAVLATGCQVASKSTLSLNGTYAVTDRALSQMTVIQTRINANAGLPRGARTIGWLDVDGRIHTFNAAQFTSFYRALTDFAFELEMLARGHVEGIPEQPVTID